VLQPVKIYGIKELDNGGFLNGDNPLAFLVEQFRPFA
jgi:hypothetical protein